MVSWNKTFLKQPMDKGILGPYPTYDSSGITRPV